MHLRMLELATEAMHGQGAGSGTGSARPAALGRPPALPAAVVHPPPPGSQGLARAVHALACAACPPLLLGQRTAWAPPQAGSDVLGCYLSPVNDTYWKKGLAPGTQRVAMCQLAAADSGAHGSYALPAPAVAAHRPGAHSCRRHNHV
jgi:hypothetical protein